MFLPLSFTLKIRRHLRLQHEISPLAKCCNRTLFLTLAEAPLVILLSPIAGYNARKGQEQKKRRGVSQHPLKKEPRAPHRAENCHPCSSQSAQTRPKRLETLTFPHYSF